MMPTSLVHADGSHQLLLRRATRALHVLQTPIVQKRFRGAKADSGDSWTVATARVSHAAGIDVTVPTTAN
jgi:hypothetical protein